MKKNFLVKLVGILIGIMLAGSLSTNVWAQGKGKGNGKGNGNGNSSASRGNSNKSKNTDDSIWNPYPDDQRGKGNGNGNGNGNGKGNGNGNGSNINKSQRFKGLSKKTGISEDTLRSRFEYERQLNPKLTYGQFVSAHMISRNHRGISTGEILGGLRNGRSLGQILQNQGWDRGKIDKEHRRIKDIYKDDKDFDDRDDYWGF